MAEKRHPGVMLIVRFKSALAREELERRYKERLPEFQALQGIVQKYYLYDPSTEEWGGLYLWDSQESLDEYVVSDLRRSIADVYEVEGTPRVETAQIVEILRPERST